MKIKGTDKDMKCRGFQFEIGKDYKTGAKDLTEDDLCTDKVFHYCASLQNVNQFYGVETDNRFFEVEVLGEEVTDGVIYGSNHIKFIREIKGEELDILCGRVNGNTGFLNSGYRNSGNRNSGDWNSGNWNSGDWNSGNWNSGDWNSGDWNSGNWNSGDWNSGNWNSGDWNSGNRNRGDWNSGNFNSCNFSSGVFCNEAEESIRLFNKPSGMTHIEFYNSRYYDVLCSAPFELTEWVEDEAKPEGGYLLTHTYKEACAIWWDKLTEENKEIIKSMPNFDAEVFKDITGIEVRK